MVEYDSTRYRSDWHRALQPATNKVIVPMSDTTCMLTGESSKMPCMRAIRYTPAVTMVAAWIRADTGVGPAMASGNHVCKGIWADFPTAPPTSRSAMAVAPAGPPGQEAASDPESLDPATARIAPMFNVPGVWNCMKRPIANAVSPIRVTLNAIRAAAPLAGS